MNTQTLLCVVNKKLINKFSYKPVITSFATTVSIFTVSVKPESGANNTNNIFSHIGVFGLRGAVVGGREARIAFSV